MQSDLQVTPEGSGHTSSPTPTQLNPYTREADAKKPRSQHQNPSLVLQEFGVCLQQRSCLCQGFSSSYPDIPEDLGSVFGHFSSQEQPKNPTQISPGEWGVHTEELGVRSLPARNVATVPKVCHESWEVSPAHPSPSHFGQNTQVRMSSSERCETASP